MQYNTEKDKIHITEYGRNIQNLLLLANTYEDRTYRTAYVEQVLEMMYLLDPQVKIVEDYKNKLWSHAFKITEYQLDVDVPEGITIAENQEEDFFHKRPLPLPYPQKVTKHRHYGIHLTRMIAKAVAMPLDEKRDEFVSLIASFMKMAQASYNRDGVTDEQIRKDLFTLSNEQLSLDENLKIKDILASKNTQIPASIGKTALKNQLKTNALDKEKQEQARRIVANTTKQQQGAQKQTQKPTPTPTVAVVASAPQPQSPTATPEQPKKKRRRGGVKHKKNKQV